MRSFDELLARYSSRFQPLSPIVSLVGGGGLSGARLWRFRAEHGELLLRAWPADGPGRRHIDQVHHWLSLSCDLGFIPVPVRDCAGQSVQEWRDLRWEITPWLGGSADPSRPPSFAHVRLAFAGLAAFHERLAVEQVEAVSVGLQQRQDELARLAGGGFDSLEMAIRSQFGSHAPYDQKALAWLALARDTAPAMLGLLKRVSGRVIRVQPVVRDARPEHFLFDDHRLSGLVDFGAMGVESVAADLARLIGEWFDGDLDARREALAAYEGVRPLDAAEARLIAVFDATAALLKSERWVRWHYLENRRFDDPQAVWDGLNRGLIRLERLVRQQPDSWLSF